MLTRGDLFLTLNKLKRDKVISRYRENFERFLSPIYKYPLRNEVICLDIDECDIKVLIIVHSKEKKISKLKFFLFFQKFNYRPDIFQTVNAGFIIENFIYHVPRCNRMYCGNDHLENYLKRYLLCKDTLYNILNRSEWEKLKNLSAEEYFDLEFRVKNPYLKNRK